jgi:hypothetical protein
MYSNPPVDSQQIEGGGADEEDRLLVGAEERAYFGDAVETARPECAGYHWNTRPDGRSADVK